MADKLHILNGDSTLHLFGKTGIKGEIFVWNEILCEGPAIDEVASEEFWKRRWEFLKLTFGPGASNYKQLIAEFKKVVNFKQYDEIILWYEFDLFCQINLLGILSWFKRRHAIDSVSIALVCIGNEPGFNRPVGLSQIPTSRYNELFKERTILTEATLDYADKVWKAYCSKDASELAFALMPHPVLTYLSKAVTCHFNRFPSNKNKLNEIEEKILTYISIESPENIDSVVRHMLQYQGYYGFGDLQYFHHLKLLKDLILFKNPMTLSKDGKLALTGSFDRSQYDSLNFNIGGANVNSFLWDDSAKELIAN